MRINHNMTALNTYNQLTRNEAAQAKTMGQLSTGKRINSAADDAAGYAISNRMENQIRGLAQATTNSQNGISLVQTATGALSQTSDILQRMRELAVNSSSDTSTADDRQQMQKEMDQLSKQITTVSNTTTFNGKNLLAGGFTNQQIQTGANAGENISLNLGAFDAKTLGLTAKAGATVTNGTSVSSAGITTGLTPEHATATGTALSGGLATVAKTNTINISLDGLSSQQLNLSISGNQSGADIAKDIQKQIDNNSVLNGKVTVSVNNNNQLVFSDTSSNQGDSSTLSVYSSNAALKLGTTSATAATGRGSVATGTYTIDGSVTKAATNAAVDGSGATLGGFQTSGGGTNISFKVDGGSAQTITLAAGQTFNSASALASAIQDQINKNSALNGKISASTNASGQLVFNDTSSNAGSASKLDVFSTAAGTALGLKTASGTVATGTNATISLNLKDSTGNILDTASLANVNNTSTSSVSFKDGLTANLNLSNETGLSSLNGAITASTVDVVGQESKSAVVGANGIVQSNATVEKGILIDTQANASDAIKTIDNAINTVNSQSATLGAIQNRFEDTVNTLGTTSQNLTSAESQITDVDMAQAVMENSKNSILSQAAQAMLGQAKSQPQSVLQLLQG